MLALEQVDGWPVAQAAVGVLTRADGVVAQRGPVDRPFAWASVTKLLTAYATLVAVQEETVDLDEAAEPAGATLRHLLAHASGLGPVRGRTLAEPEQRRIYTNVGFELAAERVAERAGMPFVDYLFAAVLEPLGMVHTRLDGSPAAGAVGPLVDLLRFGAELLQPVVLAPETLALATRVAFPGLPGVLPGFGRQRPNDWGLGFEVRGDKRPHWTGATNSPATFGHFGRRGSFVWVDPSVGVACACLTDSDFGPWAATAWPALADAVLAELA